MQEELKIDFDTLLSFTKGLIKLAQVNDLIPEEKEYIKNFFEEVALELNIDKNFEKIFQELENDNINDNDIKNLSVSEEIKEYFIKSCVFLACVDHFSEEEKIFIKNISEKLNFNNLDKIITEVKDEIMGNFKNIAIFRDSLEDLEKSISF